MIRILLYICLFLFVQIDVIGQVIAGTGQTPVSKRNEALYLLSLTKSSLESDTTLMLAYSEKGIHSSEKNKYYDLLSEFYYYVGYMYLKEKKTRKAIQYLEKAEENYSLTSDKDKKYFYYQFLLSEIYTQLGTANYRMANTDTSIFYYKKAKQTIVRLYSESPSLKHKEKLAIACYDLGYAYWVSGKYKPANEHYKEAYVHYSLLSSLLPTKVNLIRNTARCLNSIGAIYWGWSSYNKAIEYYLESLKIMEQIGYKNGIVLVLNNIGLVYYDWDNIKQAEKYHLQGYKLGLELDYTYGLAYSYINLGKVYEKKEEYEEAIAFYEKALEKYTELDKKNGISIALNNIGDVYLKLNQPKKSIQYHQKALNTAKASNRKHWYAKSAVLLATAYIMSDEPGKAEKYNLMALSLAEEGNYKEVVKDVYYNFFKINKKRKNFDEALDNYMQYTEIKDSIFSSKTIKQINELQVQYEMEKKEKENEILKKNNQIQQVTIRQQRLMQIGISIGLVLLAILAFVLFKGKQQQARDKDMLAKQNKAIQNQTQILTKAYNKLKELDKFKQGMIGMIVHDLKNPLNTILNFSSASITELNQNPKIQKKQETILQSSKQMLNLVMDMLDVQKYENAKMKIEKSETAIKQIVVQAIEQISILANEKNITIIDNTSPHHFISIDIQTIERVLINLLTNAIKYSPFNSEIKVESNINDKKQLTVSVTDYGEGIAKNKIKHVFDSFTQLSPKKSGQTYSSGIGLTFCKLAIENHDGQIWVESVLDKGTTFSFALENARMSEEPVKIEHKNQKPDNGQQLSAESKKHLKPIVDKLEKMQVYEISRLRKTIDDIKPENAEIEVWRDSLENAVLNGNNKVYKNILDLAKN